MIKPWCSNLRVITANFSDVRIFRIFMVDKAWIFHDNLPHIRIGSKFDNIFRNHWPIWNLREVVHYTEGCHSQVNGRLDLIWDMTKPTTWVCAQQRHRSASFCWFCHVATHFFSLSFTLWYCWLIHICLVAPSILINWTSPFPNLGMSGVHFHFYFISFRIDVPVSKQWRPWSAASDLDLHCLHTSQNWNARLIVLFLSFQADRPGQTVQTQIRLILIRVYTVCNSLCIFWMHYSKEKPSCSTFRVIIAIFRVSEICYCVHYVCYYTHYVCYCARYRCWPSFSVMASKSLTRHRFLCNNNTMQHPLKKKTVEQYNWAMTWQSQQN